MRRIRPLLATAAVILTLGAWPMVAQAQSMQKPEKPAMGAMKDTSAMKQDGAMGKDAMAKDGMGKDGKQAKGTMNDKTKQKSKDPSKATDAMMDKGAMAEPAKMSQP
ncbi:MAG TPA: hypothetical protein VFY20_11220 [Gemmatimonadales bacterium]|nr:hypothetical protein [Gemmatimonadales bacterium]